MRGCPDSQTKLSVAGFYRNNSAQVLPGLREYPKSEVPRLQPLSFDQFPPPLKSAGKDVFHDNRSQFPSIGKEPGVDLPILRAQARFSPSRHRESWVLIWHCVWNLHVPELEMLVRKHPTANHLRGPNKFGVFSAHGLSLLGIGSRGLAGRCRIRHPRCEFLASTRRRTARNGRCHL
jgi:hypothetical protein